MAYVRFYFLLIVASSFNSLVWAQSKNTFLQDIKTTVKLPNEAGSTVLRLFLSKGEVLAVTSHGVFRYRDGQWSGRKQGSGLRTAALDGEDNIWLADARSVFAEKQTQSIGQPPVEQTDTITSLFWDDKKLLVGTTSSLLIWDGNWKTFSGIKGARVTSIVRDANDYLYVATTKGLWRRKGEKWINLDETLMAVGNQDKYYALATTNGDKDLIYSSPWSVGSIAADGEHWVASGADGLPYGPVTAIRPGKDCIWMGTGKGAIKKDSGWHYYSGKRWLPDDQVNDILVLDSLRVWIATSKGIVEIAQQKMTLEQKADSIEKVIALRHNRRGLINQSMLKVPGDVQTSYLQNEDNDGLWTSCYLAAECFRYGVTKDSAAKANAVRTFEALERLETVTGISGYPARSYAAATDAITQSRSPHPKKWHLSADGKWYWLDDTSSDEITGHLFVLPLFYDLIANAEQKERVRQLIGRIASHVIDNNYHLIDFDGKPTRWGIWHPDSLNHSPNWMYERGLNSLQILSFMKTASHFTGDPKFEKHYQYLVNEHGYARNAVEAKMYGPFETSHSDDILNFFPYYNLIRYSKEDPHQALFVKSLNRSWRGVRNDRMPVWNVFASALLNQDCDLKIAKEEIEQYPLDLVNWTMENSHRWDLPRDPLLSRSRMAQSVRPIPTPESNISRWNTNPKHYNAGNGGKTEDSGSYFLFAYWMGRYHGFWE
ncbi:transcriptional regulator [Dyadobacter sp. 32]|uniref:transcriptional regulator n=1 Tax=Dyadobacter sp. 32 TaxID=538966 RepID=UPI0011EFFB9F